jgi:hypothetical protein
MVFILLFAVAIPWWWSWIPEIANATLLGAPIWFVSAIGGSLVISFVSMRYLSVAWASLDDEADRS